MPRHILIKLTDTKHQERILKTTREKQVTYKRNPICLIADFLTETLQAKREWQRNTIQMKEQTRNTEVQIYEEETGKLSEKEFRIMM